MKYLSQKELLIGVASPTGIQSDMYTMEHHLKDDIRGLNVKFRPENADVLNALPQNAENFGKIGQKIYLKNTKNASLKDFVRNFVVLKDKFSKVGLSKKTKHQVAPLVLLH